MVRQTVTLKLPFLRLNAAKATEFARLQDLNTEVANGILALSPAERSHLTTAHVTNVETGSAWMNQTIRNARARTTVKRFKVLPPETNSQNWTLHRVGNTYSLGFGLRRGTKKPIRASEARLSWAGPRNNPWAAGHRSGPATGLTGGSEWEMLRDYQWERTGR